MSGIAIAITCTTTSLNAQELPQPSPVAEVEQRVGLTDITISYSRPSVKDRTIWGELVPYGEVWRTGANKNTIITFSADVTIEGNAIKAGSYSIFTIPNEDSWKVMINTDIDGWGIGNYKEENNVATFSVKPMENQHVESMQFSFDAVNGNDAVLSLSWASLKVSFTVKTNTDETAIANVEAAIKDLEKVDMEKASVYRNAARYYASKGIKLDEALEYINMALELNNAWFYYITKAEVLGARGDKKGALAAVKKAEEMGKAAAEEKGEDFKYQSFIDTSMEKYK